jgi:hypothetical protein
MKKGLWLFILAAVRADYNFTKVIVPSVYHEWRQGMPDWATNETFKKEYGYDTFVYQKNNSALPNYIATNRGNENGVYFAYIVDHYDNFPDIAIFTHGISNAYTYICLCNVHMQYTYTDNNLCT